MTPISTAAVVAGVTIAGIAGVFYLVPSGKNIYGSHPTLGMVFVLIAVLFVAIGISQGTD